MDGKFESTRHLNESELAQVAAGCEAGTDCPCPGTKQEIKGAGFVTSFFFTDCVGKVYENGKAYGHTPLQH